MSKPLTPSQIARRLKLAALGTTERDWYLQQRRAISARQYAKAQACPEKAAAMRKYNRERAGIVNATGEAKSGPCEICHEEFVMLHLDHDHATGIIRGWLCKSCNQGLGFFRDSPEFLRTAAEYIEKSKETK